MSPQTTQGTEHLGLGSWEISLCRSRFRRGDSFFPRETKAEQDWGHIAVSAPWMESSLPFGQGFDLDGQARALLQV